VGQEMDEIFVVIFIFIPYRFMLFGLFQLRIKLWNCESLSDVWWALLDGGICLPWGLYLLRPTKQVHNRALSGTWAYDFSVQAVKDTIYAP
jgi:hypothetical protein